MPWSFIGMVGLLGRLPDLTEEANKWTGKFEESTTGQKALGYIKAILMHVAGTNNGKVLHANIF